MRIDLTEEIDPDPEDPEFDEFEFQGDRYFTSTYYMKYISDSNKDRCSSTITYQQNA